MYLLPYPFLIDNAHILSITIGLEWSMRHLIFLGGIQGILIVKRYTDKYVQYFV